MPTSPAANDLVLFVLAFSAALSTSVNIEPHNNSHTVFSNDPVFYGPDGKIITEEESSFLSGILNAATETQTEDEEYDRNNDKMLFIY